MITQNFSENDLLRNTSPEYLPSCNRTTKAKSVHRTDRVPKTFLSTHRLKLKSYLTGEMPSRNKAVKARNKTERIKINDNTSRTDINSNKRKCDTSISNISILPEGKMLKADVEENSDSVHSITSTNLEHSFASPTQGSSTPNESRESYYPDITVFAPTDGEIYEEIVIEEFNAIDYSDNPPFMDCHDRQKANEATNEPKASKVKQNLTKSPSRQEEEPNRIPVDKAAFKISFHSERRRDNRTNPYLIKKQRGKKFETENFNLFNLESCKLVLVNTYQSTMTSATPSVSCLAIYFADYPKTVIDFNQSEIIRNSINKFLLRQDENNKKQVQGTMIREVILTSLRLQFGQFHISVGNEYSKVWVTRMIKGNDWVAAGILKPLSVQDETVAYKAPTYIFAASYKVDFDEIKRYLNGKFHLDSTTWKLLTTLKKVKERDNNKFLVLTDDIILKTKVNASKNCKLSWPYYAESVPISAQLLKPNKAEGMLRKTFDTIFTHKILLQTLVMLTCKARISRLRKWFATHTIESWNRSTKTWTSCKTWTLITTNTRPPVTKIIKIINVACTCVNSNNQFFELKSQASLYIEFINLNKRSLKFGHLEPPEIELVKAKPNQQMNLIARCVCTSHENYFFAHEILFKSIFFHLHCLRHLMLIAKNLFFNKNLLSNYDDALLITIKKNNTFSIPND